MKKLCPLFRQVITLSLLFSLVAGIVISDNRMMSASAKVTQFVAASWQDKVAPDLRALVLSGSQTPVKVIVQFNSTKSNAMETAMTQKGRGRKNFQTLNSAVVEIPADWIDDLAAYSGVRYISSDSATRSFGHVTTTTGAEAVRQQTKTTTSLLGGTTTTSYTLDGTGVGIAVIDSGVDASHTSFLDKSNGVRVVRSVDFTGENRTDDPYGHGTHVAAAAAGNGRISNGAYTGIAPNASIINLRVLNKDGMGTTAALLSALDWTLQHGAENNIRVVNLSVGTPAVDSYKNDPLCRAVRKLVDAGVVVVVAAGNNGKNSSGQKVYGQIHSPGDEPAAITVGASNTFGTDGRSDDAVTTYSSRGPTRGSWTDAAGVKHYDNLIKPDLVAPGNKMIYAQAVNNLLVTQNPQLDAAVSPVAVRDQMYLNGTSMSSPVVAGAAALLLQANPKLTPNMVKMILMYTAQQLRGFNTLEQGAGELNVEGAVRLAKLVKTDLLSTTLVGAPLLTSATPPAPQTTIAGQSFVWSQGVIIGDAPASGTDLITKYQRIYDLGVVLGDGVILGDGVVIGDNMLLSMGVVIGDQMLTSDGTTINGGTPFLSCSVLMSDAVIMGDGVILGDGVVMGDGVVIGDSVLMSDFTLQAQSAQEGGDATSCVEPVVDTGVDYLGY
jgi:serine protease AprX